MTIGPRIIIIKVTFYYVLNFIPLLTCNFIKLILLFTIEKNVSFKEKNLLIPKSRKSTVRVTYTLHKSYLIYKLYNSLNLNIIKNLNHKYETLKYKEQFMWFIFF